MMRFRAPILLALLCGTSLASAEESRIVRGSRLHLSDLIASLPAEVPDLELGASPPPGSSRLVSKGEIESAALRRGVSVKSLKLPSSVRVVSAAKRWSADELVNAALPTLTSALPSGVSVKRARTSAKAVTVPDASVSAVRLPKLPRREGEHMTTGTIELSSDGEIVARIPLSLTLDIGAAAAIAAITKGARVQLMIESGPARITATAVALADGEIGDTLQFRVITTQKILYGKVMEPTLARVVQ
jgi:Chaperone for flagella basal body P-ring formation